MNRLIEQLASWQEPALFFSDVLHAYRKRHQEHLIADQRSMLLARVNERLRSDKDLKHPHRKIVECLLDQFDVQQGIFQEVQFSNLVKKSRIGKSAAKGYLQFLEGKSYVEKRSDGYRLYFRLSGSLLGAVSRQPHHADGNL